ncbi:MULTISPECIES: MurR/RpiR family transcriptional regulator [Thioclava]|uniref:MurR/RpiR family transcriptional regulator n=1 Tax=Thioclava TaxID=285107 RepID=UPI0020A30804|nr:MULTISPECIES: MurR/RpiR family transcriptional regulator [Thioclava]
MSGSFEQRLAAQYGNLSTRLREAGDYIADNPVSIATRSLRTLASESNLAPATFTRLAHALEYENFEELRETMRDQIGRRVSPFADRADRLQKDAVDPQSSFLNRYAAATQDNIAALSAAIEPGRLEAVADKLAAARRVVLLGALGSTGIAEYTAYIANFLGDNWELGARAGSSLGATLAGLDERDAVLVITKPPFARSTIRSAIHAHEQGAYVALITDSRSCPALHAADETFIVPTDSPHFYTSYVATLFLLEAILALVAKRAGPRATERIAEVERRNRLLDEVYAR